MTTLAAILASDILLATLAVLAMPLLSAFAAAFLWTTNPSQDPGTYVALGRSRFALTAARGAMERRRTLATRPHPLPLRQRNPLAVQRPINGI